MGAFHFFKLYKWYQIAQSITYVLSKKLLRKLNSFTLSSYINSSTKKRIFNLIIKSLFNYCSLVWMFCSGISNNIINKSQERSLRLILNDYSSNFNQLFKNSNDICYHHRNIHTLLTEVFWMKNELAPPIMESV